MFTRTHHHILELFDVDLVKELLLDEEEPSTFLEVEVEFEVVLILDTDSSPHLVGLEEQRSSPDV